MSLFLASMCEIDLLRNCDIVLYLMMLFVASHFGVGILFDAVLVSALLLEDHHGLSAAKDPFDVSLPLEHQNKIIFISILKSTKDFSLYFLSTW